MKWKIEIIWLIKAKVIRDLKHKKDMLHILKLRHFKWPQYELDVVGQLLNSNRRKQTLFCVIEFIIQVTWCLFNLCRLL